MSTTTPSDNLATITPADADPVPRPANDPKHPDAPPGERVFRHIIDMRLMLIGIVIGFVVCVAMGYVYSHRAPYRNVIRFHPYVGPESNFFPTSTQLAESVMRRVKDGQIVVIVGGNSIFYGSGQSQEQLWSLELQRQLGDGYAVRNLALRGADFAAGGAVVAEMLHARGYRVIYLANLAIANYGNPFEGTYAYLFWDAYTKGELLHDKNRDALMNEVLSRGTLKPTDDDRRRAKFREVVLAQRLNSYLRFNDMWTAFTYSKASLAYSLTLHPEFWRPRRECRDPEPPPPDELDRRYPQRSYDNEMNYVRAAQSGLLKKDASGQWVANESHPRWKDFDAYNPNVLTSAIRDRTLIAVVHDSSYYINRQPEDVPQQYRAAVAETTRRLKTFGYESVDVGGDFSDSDFADRCHLSPTGGARLATTLAPLVRDMAKRLEYLR